MNTMSRFGRTTRVGGLVRSMAVACAASFGFAATDASGAGGDPPYLSVPRVGVQSVERFRSLFESARSDVVRILILGDSQETMPAGWGSTYVPHLNARFAGIYGPAGESMLYTNLDAASPPHWLASLRTSTSREPTSVPDSSILPSMSIHRLLEDNGSPTGAFRALFLHDASAAAEARYVGGPWFTERGPYAAEILAVAREVPTALRWLNAPSDEDVVHAGADAVAAGTLVLPRKATPGSFHWLQTPALDFAGKRHLQLALSGASSKVGTDVVGVRYRTLGPRTGVVVQSFARGGMRLVQLLESHASSGAFLRAVDPSAIVLHFGANDAGGVDPQEWRMQLLATIQWIRTELGDAHFPVIIASDLRGGIPESYPRIDAMPGVAHEIAMQDQDVLAINLPRIVAEEYLWLDRRPYLFDSAHFHPYAQRMLAEAFVGELRAVLSIPDPGCGEKQWADCVRAVGSTCTYGGCVLVTDADAIALGIAWNGPGSDCSDADADGFPDLCPPAANPDLNGDGRVDAADLSIMLSLWGTDSPLADIDFDGNVGATDLAVLLAGWGT